MRGFVHHHPVSMCGLPNLRLRREKLKLVARRVFGTEAAVLEWMRTPNQNLGGVTPESLLDTLDGFEQALAELESTSPEPR
ncbi:MAG: DUF2384 domain-containing protein [Archangiaceae bacterium]|nr:DUF2384 domain-containing protein [Archangiaceae bacterium]